MLKLKYLIVGVLAALLLGAAPATAQPVDPAYIGTAQIKDGAVKKQDLGNQSVTGKKVRNRTLTLHDFTKNAIARLTKQIVNTIEGQPGLKGEKGDTGATGPAGPQGAPGLSALESDGPYPGATNLVEGDNSTSFWAGDGSLQRSWVQCPAGKVATGGGFTLAADASLADKLATQVVTSAPVQVEGGNPDTYNPIAEDPDGSFVPNGWLVEGVYNGANTSLIVRPHVICVKVAA
jgi:hypothetical protein